jgi:hypothetical protein
MSIGWQPKNQDKIQQQWWELSKYGAQLKECSGLQTVCALIRMLVGMHYAPLAESQVLNVSHQQVTMCAASKIRCILGLIPKIATRKSWVLNFCCG